MWKRSKGMYRVRCLQKNQIDNKLLCLFYNSVISSVSTLGIRCWFAGCDKQFKKSITKFARKMSKLADSKAGCLIE